jgi:hypothetical protein
MAPEREFLSEWPAPCLPLAFPIIKAIFMGSGPLKINRKEFRLPVVFPWCENEDPATGWR